MTLCGAKTRKGDICKNAAMKNGRCRMHGGKSTGAPQRNKNAVVTGEYEAIWLDAFDDDEKSLFALTNVDIKAQIDNEIRMLDIRERRMLKRIQSLTNKSELMITSSNNGSSSNTQSGDSTSETERAELTIDVIQRIEEALTRVQDKKAKYIELKHKLNPQLEDADKGNLDQLTEAIKMSAKILRGE